MKLEWDPNKAAANWRKHRVDFADAVTVLEDDYALTIEDDDEDEVRFVTVGADATGRILVLVYTVRGDAVRIISARKATARERKQYEASA